MDYFVIALIEELEKIATINEELKAKQQKKITDAINNNSAKKQLTSKLTPNSKARVASISQQNAVQQMENYKNV